MERGNPNGGINKIYYVRIMDAEVIDLFPSTVLKFKNKDQEVFDELEECVKAIEQNENLTLHTGVNIPNDQSWLHFFGNYRLPK